MTDRRLLAAGERAAFHGRPADGIAPLQKYLFASWPEDPERGRAQWLLGVCMSSAGLFGSAATQLQPLLVLPPEAPPRTRHIGGAAACTLASIHRQVGKFAEARAYDDWAGSVAAGDPRVAFEAMLGSAADSVGMGDREGATSKVAQARAMCSENPSWWRERIRLGWVQCEVALILDRAAEAIPPLTRSVQEAEQVGAPRHVAKSLLFLAAAMQAVADPAALSVMGRAAMLAESLGAWPLVWASRGTLVDWLQDSDPEAAERCRLSAGHAVRTMAADMPGELATQWLARPDVSKLLRS